MTATTASGTSIGSTYTSIGEATAPVSGRYLVIGMVAPMNVSGSDIFNYIQIKGTPYAIRNIVHTNTEPYFNFVGIQSVTAGNKIEIATSNALATKTSFIVGWIILLHKNN